MGKHVFDKVRARARRRQQPTPAAQDDGTMLLVSYAYLPGGGRQPTAAAALVDDAGREPAFTEVAETWHGLVQKVVDRIHEEFGDRSLRIQHVPLTTDAERPLLEVLRDDPRTIGQL